MYQNDFQQFKNIPSILRLLEEEENEPQVKPPQKYPEKIPKESKPSLNVNKGEFDPAIQIGRGKNLYLKRNYIERLIKETRYTEDELRDIKEIYVQVAEPENGLNLDRFKEFLRYVYNIDSHVLAKRLFYFFDKNQDGIVEYFEIIKSLDIIEKGDFDEKVELCFRIYDPDDMGYLDPHALRELFKISYTNIITSLDKCLIKIQQVGDHQKGITWKQLSDPKEGIIQTLKDCLSIILGKDRYDNKRVSIEDLELRSGFNIDKLDKLFGLYRTTQKMQRESYNKNYYQSEMNIPDSTYLTLNQFKLVMLDIFKVSDTKLLNSIFTFIDKRQEGSVKIEDIVTEMVFYLKGPFEKKIMLFFDANSVVSEGSLIISRSFLGNYLKNHLNFFEEVYKSSQDIAKHMKRPNQDNIYLQDFKEFCYQFPSAMDFIAKITIGNHPFPLTPYQTMKEQKSPQKAIGYIDDTENFQVFNQTKQDSPHDKHESRSFKDREFFQKRWVPRTTKPGI